MGLGSKYTWEISSDIQISHKSNSLIPYSSILEAIVPSFELLSSVLSSKVTTHVTCGYSAFDIWFFYLGCPVSVKDTPDFKDEYKKKVEYLISNVLMLITYKMIFWIPCVK